MQYACAWHCIGGCCALTPKKGGVQKCVPSSSCWCKKWADCWDSFPSKVPVALVLVACCMLESTSLAALCFALCRASCGSLI